MRTLWSFLPDRGLTAFRAGLIGNDGGPGQYPVAVKVA
jgi:hypothetical protein